jgi:hypothetical protein
MAAFVGGELFPSFESSLFGDSEGGGLGGGAASLTVAQDISELFGSHWTAPEEENGALERRFRWQGRWKACARPAGAAAS